MVWFLRELEFLIVELGVEGVEAEGGFGVERGYGKILGLKEGLFEELGLK